MNVMAHARISGIINLGGGTTKSFIQQATLSSFLQKEHHHGHKYAIQISTDAPHPGGRSNAVSFDEGLVYGKLARGAHTAYVPCDATIALPILITSLSQTAAKYMVGKGERRRVGVPKASNKPRCFADTINLCGTPSRQSSSRRGRDFPGPWITSQFTWPSRAGASEWMSLIKGYKLSWARA